MPVAADIATPFGTSPANATDMYEPEWVRLLGGLLPTAAIGEWGLSSGVPAGLTLVGSGSSTNTIVKAGGLNILGQLGVWNGDKTVNHASVGTQPTGSQLRRDLVVVRRKMGGSRGIELDIVPGTPASPSSAQLPELQRNKLGTFEHPLGEVPYDGSAIGVDEPITYRYLAARGTYVGQSAPIPDDAPDGSIWFQFDDILAVVRNTAGNALEPRSILDTRWTTPSLPSGSVSIEEAFRYRRHHGVMQFAGNVGRDAGFSTGWSTVLSLSASASAGLPRRGTVPITGWPGLIGFESQPRPYPGWLRCVRSSYSAGATFAVHFGGRSDIRLAEFDGAFFRLSS